MAKASGNVRLKSQILPDCYSDLVNRYVRSETLRIKPRLLDLQEPNSGCVFQSCRMWASSGLFSWVLAGKGTMSNWSSGIDLCPVCAGHSSLVGRPPLELQ